jgi:hypothetical protein
MRQLTRNSKIYRQILLNPSKRLFAQSIGTIIRGNIKPLLAYLEYLKLENSIKEKLIESFAGDLEDLKYALFNCGYIESKTLRLLALEKSIILEFPDKYKFYVNHLLDYCLRGYFMKTKHLFSFKSILEKQKYSLMLGQI